LARPAVGGAGGHVLLRELPPGQDGTRSDAGFDDEDRAAVQLLEQVVSGTTAAGGHMDAAPAYRHTFPVGHNDAGYPFGPVGSF